MFKLLSSMLCTSSIHLFSLGNVTYIMIGNLLRIRVTSVKWTWLGLGGLLPSMLPCARVIEYHHYLDAKHHASLMSNFLLKNSLYLSANEIINFQK